MNAIGIPIIMHIVWAFQATIRNDTLREVDISFMVLKTINIDIHFGYIFKLDDVLN